MSRLVIYGAGGFGREVAALAIRMNREFVFADDGEKPPIWGIPVLRPEQIKASDDVCIAVGSSDVRQIIAARLGRRSYATLIAPTAIIGPDVIVDDGAVICDGAMITATSRIGRQFQCNICSYVAHDCVIGDSVTLAPRVSLNGNITIEDGVYIGAGAVIRQGLVIGANAIVGMGAIVTKNVPPRTTVAGNPARPLERPVLKAV